MDEDLLDTPTYSHSTSEEIDDTNEPTAEPTTPEATTSTEAQTNECIDVPFYAPGIPNTSHCDEDELWCKVTNKCNERGPQLLCPQCTSEYPEYCITSRGSQCCANEANMDCLNEEEQTTFNTLSTQSNGMTSFLCSMSHMKSYAFCLVPTIDPTRLMTLNPTTTPTQSPFSKTPSENPTPGMRSQQTTVDIQTTRASTQPSNEGTNSLSVPASNVPMLPNPVNDDATATGPL